MNDHHTDRSSYSTQSGGLQRRITRRSLLRGAAGLGAGAIALGVTGPGLTRASNWTPMATADQYGPDVALEWFQLAFDIMPTTPGFSPGAAVRAFGYLGVTLYEAIVPGMPGRESLVGRLNELTPVPGPHDRAYHWPSCANAALAQGVRDLYRMTTAENLAAIDALEASIAADLASSVPTGIAERSALRGRRVADHIMAWAATDRANVPTEPYVPPVGPGLWVPTPPAYAGPADPYGGMARPIRARSGRRLQPGRRQRFSTDPTSEFYVGELEVYNTVNTLTDEQLTIALYWARTVGHPVSIAVQAIEQSGCDLGTATLALTAAGIACQDSGIAVFYSKYAYNLLRPITYIREHIDPTWGNPLPVTTPPHPDYPAAHAITLRAFAQALYDVLGDFPFTDRTWVHVGLAPRSWNSWFDMAAETAISRMYGGIHSRWANEAGFEQGRQVGEAVSAIVI